MIMLLCDAKEHAMFCSDGPMVNWVTVCDIISITEFD